MRVVDLKALMKEHGLRGYSRFNKAELIAFIQNNLQPRTRPPPIPASRPPPAPRIRPPPRPTRPPPSPPPVRPRQEELKPYQLKPKRGKETFIEPPMKKSLLELLTQSRLNV